MGSYVKMIDCPYCGNTHAYVDVDYKDKEWAVGCDDCLWLETGQGELPDKYR